MFTKNNWPGKGTFYDVDIVQCGHYFGGVVWTLLRVYRERIPHQKKTYIHTKARPSTWKGIMFTRVIPHFSPSYNILASDLQLYKRSKTRSNCVKLPSDKKDENKVRMQHPTCTRTDQVIQNKTEAQPPLVHDVDMEHNISVDEEDFIIV